MSTEAASNIDHLAEDGNNKSMTKEPKNGRGRAVRDGPTITPEATPEPEVARNEADRRRRQEEEEEEQSTNNQATGDNDQADLVENSKTGQQAKGKSAEKKSPATKALQAFVSDEGDDQTAGDNNQGALEQSSKKKQQVKGKSAKMKTTTAKLPRDDEASGNESDGLFVGSSASPQKSSETVADKKQGKNREGKSWTDEQEKEIERILGVPPNLHFKILGLNGIMDAEKAPSAYKKLALRIHPDKNGHPDANKAFARLKEAADAYGLTKEIEVGESFLDDEGNPMDIEAIGSEAGTDSEGSGQSDDEGNPMDIEAIGSEAGTDSEGSGQSDDESDDDQGAGDSDDTHKPVKLYEEATTHIANLQKDPKSKNAIRKLGEINDRIKKMNQDAGVEPVDQWTIDYQGLAEYYREAMPFIHRVKENPADDAASQKINEVNKRLEEFIEKRKYLNWRIHPDVVFSELPEPAKPTPAKEPATPKEPAAPIPAKKARASPKPAPKWRPGLTEKGERILAMAPTETTDVLGNPTMTRCLFLIEKKGRTNPIAFEDAADIGEKAARGYLEQLPKTERIDIRSKSNDYSPRNRQGFVRIKGVAAKEGDNPNRYPDCAIWVEYEDGSYKFPNRSGCRAIWKSKADRMIEDFFINNKLEIPWLKRAKRPYQTEVAKSRSTRASSSRIRETPWRTTSPETPWRTRSPERGRSSRSPNRRRSSSTSSSASYLSDEGLERLEGIEDRMTNFESKFEKMFMKMSEKIDALDSRSSR